MYKFEGFVKVEEKYIPVFNAEGINEVLPLIMLMMTDDKEGNSFIPAN